MLSKKITVAAAGTVVLAVICCALGTGPALAKKNGIEVRTETGSSGKGSGPDSRQVQNDSSSRDQGSSGGGSSSGSSGHGNGGGSGSSHGDGLGEVAAGVDRGSSGSRSPTIAFRDYDRL